MDKWALITTYKIVDPPDTNFRFLQTFINFYNKLQRVSNTTVPGSQVYIVLLL